MVKMRSFCGVVAVLILVAGCSHPELVRNKAMGKYLNSDGSIALKTKGQECCKTAHFDFDFSYEVAPDSPSIRLQGAALYHLTTDESEFHSETVLLEVQSMAIALVFIDANSRVVGVEGHYLDTGKNIYDPIPFSFTLPFKPDYKRMFISYDARFQGN